VSELFLGALVTPDTQYVEDPRSTVYEHSVKRCLNDDRTLHLCPIANNIIPDGEQRRSQKGSRLRGKYRMVCAKPKNKRKNKEHHHGHQRSLPNSNRLRNAVLSVYKSAIDLSIFFLTALTNGNNNLTLVN